MKNDLTCEVVQDLLPLYVEDLIHEETRQAVDRHLKDCPDCTARKEAMESPASADPAAADQQAEVDYLRKVRRKNRGRIVLAVAATVAVLVAALTVKAFWIGKKADLEGMTWQVSETEEGLDLRVRSVWSGVAYVGWQQQEQGENTWSLETREVLPLPGITGGEYETVFPLDGTGTVLLCGEIIWKDGITVQPRTLRAWQSRTPYMGAASKLAKVAGALRIDEECGAFSFALQSGQEPYGWTLNFADPYTPAGAETLNREMTRKACQALALVGNLGEVSWTWRLTDGEEEMATLTREEAEAYVAEQTRRYNEEKGTAYPDAAGIKSYGEDAAAFQMLCDVLG